MTSIIEQLRALSEYRHDDLSIGAEAADEIEQLRAERDALLAQVQAGRDLMAIVHRDGGHYCAQHGDRKAADDAITLVCELRAERNALRADAERYRWLRQRPLVFGMMRTAQELDFDLRRGPLDTAEKLDSAIDGARGHR